MVHIDVTDERHELGLTPERLDLVGRDVLQDGPLAGRAANAAGLVRAVPEERDERLARELPDGLLRDGRAGESNPPTAPLSTIHRF